MERNRLDEEIVALLRNPEVPSNVIADAIIEREGDVASVWIVQGHTGEYSDERDWSVAAFLDKGKAEQICEELNQWCKDRNLYGDDVRCCGGQWDRRGKVHPPQDPNFDFDSLTGTHYFVYNVDLIV